MDIHKDHIWLLDRESTQSVFGARARADAPAYGGKVYNGFETFPSAFVIFNDGDLDHERDVSTGS